MHPVERMVSRWEENTIKGSDIDWMEWLKPSDVARITPAENLHKEGKDLILVGNDHRPGLTLPWGKTHNDVLISPGKLAVWTGWSFHGKSQMLKFCMLHAIANGEKPIICSMEEDIRDIWAEMAIMYAGNDNPTPRVIDEFAAFIKGKLWFYDQQGTVEASRMVAVTRYAASRLGATQCVIDSLMMLGIRRDDYDSQSAFLTDLKVSAKDTKATIHLVAHMRKSETSKGEERPGKMHDISGPHDIGSKADYVFNVWRNKNKKDPTDIDCSLMVEKQRGRKPFNWIGGVNLNYHKASGQFVDGRQPIEFKGG